MDNFKAKVVDKVQQPVKFSGMLLGQLISVWMNENERSIRDVAAEIGIDHTILHRIIKGRDHGGGRTVIKLMNWLFSERKHGNHSRR